jgi:hypothetical protein
MLQCKDDICSDRREPRGPGQRPGVQADVDSSRFASARLRRSPGSAQAGGVKGGPAGPSAAPLDTAGYDIDPTDGGRDLHRRRAGHAAFYSQITSPNTRRFTSPLTLFPE